MSKTSAGLVVLAVCVAGLSGYFLWETRASSSTETEAPIELQSRVSIDQTALAALLADANYAGLERRLDLLLASFKKDWRSEDAVFEAYQALGGVEPGRREQLDAWVAANPGSATARAARSLYLMELAWARRGGAFSSETSDEKLDEFRQLLDLAMQEAQVAIELDASSPIPHLVELRYAKGTAALQGCLKVGDEKIQLFPTSYRMWRFVVQCAEPRWGGSYELIEKLAKLAQAHVAANPRLASLQGYPHWSRGRDLKVQDQFEPALAEFEKALSFGTEEMFLREHMTTLKHLQRFPEALRDANQIVDLFPHSERKSPIPYVLDAYRAWAFKQHKAGKTEEAIVAYTNLIEHKPKDAELLYWRAAAEGALGRNDAALAGYRAVIEIDHGRIDAYKAADRLLALQQRWDEVLALWDSYIVTRPNDAEAYFQRGGTNFHKGDYAAALADARKACDLGKQEACVWAMRLSGKPP